jgi:hypothetical protein
MVAAVASLVIRFRRSRGVERQQLKWFTYAGALTILWLLVTESLIPDVLGEFFWLLVALVPISAGIAIMRYRLYDIDRLITRTLVYGLLTAVLAGVYAGLVLVLGQLTGGIAANPPSWVVAGATLAVAALFQPARRRIQQMVDRRFNRRSTTLPGRSRRSAFDSATRWTWTRCRPSCWPSPTKRCSQRPRPCGCDQRHGPRMVN